MMSYRMLAKEFREKMEVRTPLYTSERWKTDPLVLRRIICDQQMYWCAVKGDSDGLLYWENQKALTWIKSSETTTA